MRKTTYTKYLTDSVEQEIQKRLELVQPAQEVSEPQENATIEQLKEKQGWQPFDEV